MSRSYFLYHLQKNLDLRYSGNDYWNYSVQKEDVNMMVESLNKHEE